VRNATPNIGLLERQTNGKGSGLDGIAVEGLGEPRGVTADSCFGHFKLCFGVPGANSESDNFLRSALPLTDCVVYASEVATHEKPMGRLIGCMSVGSVARARINSDSACFYFGISGLYSVSWQLLENAGERGDLK
jgi:hypothetical protein